MKTYLITTIKGKVARSEPNLPITEEQMNDLNGEHPFNQAEHLQMMMTGLVQLNILSTDLDNDIVVHELFQDETV